MPSPWQPSSPQSGLPAEGVRGRGMKRLSERLEEFDIDREERRRAQNDGAEDRYAYVDSDDEAPRGRIREIDHERKYDTDSDLSS